LKPNHNLLVVFEELGGDPSKISLVKRSVSSVCADVSEYHPNIKNWHIDSYGKSEDFHPPKVHLHCNPGQAISSIKFASFGTPLGTCGSYEQGACHSSASYDILEKVTQPFASFNNHRLLLLLKVEPAILSNSITQFSRLLSFFPPMIHFLTNNNYICGR
jgi:hypothetical protein